jgi:hypothetical protein
MIPRRPKVKIGEKKKKMGKVNETPISKNLYVVLEVDQHYT